MNALILWEVVIGGDELATEVILDTSKYVGIDQ